MKMTNVDMANAVEILASAQETGKLGFAIARNLRKLRDECKEYLDIRDENLKKYGTAKDLGNGRINYTFKTQEDHEAYLKALKEYDDIECEVDVFTVPEDVFIGGKLTSSQMSYLLWMIDDESPKKGED